MIVPAHTLETLLLYSFRYALGRMTGAPSQVSDAIRAHAAVVPAWMRAQMADDIAQARKSKGLGWPCDQEVWDALEAWLRGTPSGGDEPPQAA